MYIELDVRENLPIAKPASSPMLLERDRGENNDPGQLNRGSIIKVLVRDVRSLRVLCN